jgi:predicted DNA-binding protein (MmcQ/YjbR family)
MDAEFIRKYCLAFPGSKEEMPWENHLAYKVGGKIFLIYNLSKEYPNRLSLKCSPEKFNEMIEVEKIIPAPYLARNKWISIQDGCRIRTAELKELIEESYNIVFSKLPVKTKKEITLSNSPHHKKSGKR